MLGRVRSVLGVAFLAGCTWCAFAVRLGDKTFVEHLDAIGDTPEAKALRSGANRTLVPTLEELKERVLGEYVEAPTSSDLTLASGAPASPVPTARKRTKGSSRDAKAATRGPGTPRDEPTDPRAPPARRLRSSGIPRAQ